MDWLDRMNAAMDYIEANLAGTIDMRVAAHGACCSEYHFTRMFSFIVGVPISDTSGAEGSRSRALSSSTAMRG